MRLIPVRRRVYILIRNGREIGRVAVWNELHHLGVIDGGMLRMWAFRLGADYLRFSHIQHVHIPAPGEPINAFKITTSR